MPVSTGVRDGMIVLTVDGDYTANELRRVAFSAFEASDVSSSVPILLDMSGAAGLALLSIDDWRASGTIFAAYRDRISAIGIVASAEVQELFSVNGDFGRETGVEVKVCQSHGDAREWLGGIGDSE